MKETRLIVRCTSEELTRWQGLAIDAKTPLSRWVRERLNSIAHSQAVPKDEKAPVSNRKIAKKTRKPAETVAAAPTPSRVDTPVTFTHRIGCACPMCKGAK